ncbi:hypothetical protein V8F20_011179 [Naviculisporaceae sp. PSN 640]
MGKKVKAAPAWRPAAPPVKLDIVGDFSGNGLFGIHGDALLSYCLDTAKVDFEPGFQLLHAVHAVESLLFKLRDRGCNFQIFWFGDDETFASVRLDSDSSKDVACKYRLARSVLMRHFALESSGQLSFCFPSIHSEAFLNHVENHAFRFFLVSDSSTLCLGEGKDVKQADSRLLRFMKHMHTCGYFVATFEKMEFKSSKAYVYMCSPRGDVTSFEVDHTASLSVDAARQDSIHEKLKAISQLGQPNKLTVREILTLYALTSVLSPQSNERPKPSFMRNAAAVLVQLVALRHLPLSQRSFPDQPSDWDPGQYLSSFALSFYGAVQEALCSWPEHLSLEKWDGFDLFDGRLFLAIWTDLARIALPERIADEISQLVRYLELLSSVDVSKYLTNQPAPPKCLSDKKIKTKVNPETSRGSTVLAFSHPVLDQYLEKVKISTTFDEPSATAPRIFEELTHWHNTKSLDPKLIPKPKGFFARKRDQKFRADTIAYSASLTGASGKNIDPEIIVVNTARETNPKEIPGKDSSTKSAANSKGRTRPMSGREKALEKARLLSEQKLAQKTDAVVISWKERCKEFERETSLTARYQKVEKYLLGLSRSHASTIGGEVGLYLATTLHQLQDACKSSRFKSSLLALLWYRMINTSKFNLTQEVFQSLSVLSAGFQTPLNPVSLEMLPSRPLPFTAPKKELAKVRSVGDPISFQLEFCGPYLERSFDSAPDNRVPFEPDAWQRKVLDAVDCKKSLLVVAPTSAGKTFISFYAMKTVLQSNDDDVIVYVAPTKALVNQIAAEIQARFTKSYHHAAKSVWAIHTRDYRVNNPQGCQVLVTVPSILQIMLLAPSNSKDAKSFSRRIKWIIFDEVHCIGQSDEGVIWEQLLLLAPCPLIALSATIGNPFEFRDWLRDVQKSKGFEFEMVMHSARYSDLRKFYHDPEPSVTEFKGLSAVDRLPLPGLDSDLGLEKSPFLHVHPIASIIDRSRETLADTSLEPSDCLSLWKCMIRRQNAQYPVPESLNPNTALSNPAKKSDVVAWESKLKETLSGWIVDSKSPFKDVQNDLRGARWQEMLSAQSDNTGEQVPKEVVAPRVSSGSVFSLVVDLRSSGALPAILFNYDRVNCENIAHELLNTLETAEKAFKKNDRTWAAKMASFEKWKTVQEATRRKASKGPKTGGKKQDDEEKSTKSEQQRDEANRETSKWANFDPGAALAQFSFADTTKMTQAEVQERIDSLEKGSVPRPIIRALYRGVGVHHSGMNRGYRQVVEMMARKGYLTVVVATGTLALGVNLPCKTVVFTGDSVYLTALNYRQGSGRAGRRGFDLLGNVVFHDIHPHRAFDIMSARLPDLRGQFPTSVSLVLRLFILLHGTQNSAFAAKAVGGLLSQNRLFLGGPAAEMSVTHHLRFTIDYLRRQHLLSKTGEPLNFSGLIGHLYYTENAVFAFHALMKEGYWHDICKGIDDVTKQQAIILEIVTVLCHLFCRIPCYRFANKDWLEGTVKRSSSIVLLPALPLDAERILEKHNKQTLEIFQCYVMSYAVQHLSNTPDIELPFTRAKVQSAELDAGSHGLSIPSVLPSTTVRSPFSALSGLQDNFTSIHELCETVRSGVFLEESAIPYIPVTPEETGKMPWNAYLLDFFKHGDMGALVRENGIKGGDVWFRLKDFSLVLASIVASLENLLDPNLEGGEDGTEMEMEDAWGEDTFGERGEMESEMKNMSLNPSSQPTNNPLVAGKKKKKKVVVDSWEDESSDESGIGSDANSGISSGAASSFQNSSTGLDVPSWEQQDGKSLKNVHGAFVLLKEQFEEKFRKTWA